MIPLPVIGVKTAFMVHSAVFIWLSKVETKGLKSRQVTDCSVGPPTLLLAYRLFNLALCLSVGVSQLITLGPVIFRYFTIWNWWLLTLFFACGSAASLREVMRERQKPHRYRTRAVTEKSADWLDRAVVGLFHVVTPMAFVVDTITWTVLVPSLMADPDPVVVAHWTERMFNWNSYMQHGVNAGMVLGEALLSEMPGLLYHGGFVGLWGSAYSIWSVIYYSRHSRFIYPFLDHTKPSAWIAYLALYLVHWIASMLFLGMVWLKHHAVGRFRGARGGAHVKSG